MNLLTKIYKNQYSWLSIQEVFTFIVNYGLVIILARLLNPESFGVVALLNLYTGFFSIIAGFGIGKLIVKDQIKNNVKLNALLVGNILISCVIFTFALTFLGLFLWFYFDKNYKYFNYGVLSLVSIFTSSLYSFTTALYIRDKKFIKMAKLTIISYAISFVIIVIFSYLNRSTLSLLVKQIVVAIIPIIILILSSDFKFRPVFSKSILTYFYSFSKFIALNNIFNYFVRNLDYLILGRFFNAQIIGQYSIAYKILVTPVKMIVKQIDKVSFPNLAIMSNKTTEFKKYYLNNISFIAQTIFPGVITIIIFSDVIVNLFFDSRYDKLATIISILSISALFQSVTSLVGNLYIISNNTKRMFSISVLLFVLLFLFLLVGASTKNIFYFTVSYVLAYVFTNFPITNYYALKPFHIKVKDIIKRMILPTLISLFFLGSIYIFNYFYPLNVYFKIALISISIIVIYLLINEKIQQLLGIKNVWNRRNI